MSEALKPVRPFSDLLRVFTGPAIWFAHLAVIYGAEALICTKPTAFGGSPMVWTVTTVTAAAVIGLVIFAGALHSAPPNARRGSAQSGSTLLPTAALTLTLLSMLGVIWTALPTALLPACTSPAG